MKKDPRVELENLRHQIQSGTITYDQAELLAKPIVEHINKRGEVLAKKHGFRYKKMSFGYLIR